MNVMINNAPTLVLLLLILLVRESTSFNQFRSPQLLSPDHGSTTARSVAASVTPFPGDRADPSGRFLDDLMDELKRERDMEDANERMLRERQERLRDRETLTNSRQYELTLKRPLGFSIGESGATGFVVVTEINESVASNLVKHAVAVGDRVVAIESALGGKLWPVSTVEGAISAVTGRLPGTSVSILFEKMTTSVIDPEVLDQQVVLKRSVDIATSADRASATTVGTGKVTYAESPATAMSMKSRLDLRQRCRDVLRRYSNADENRKNVSIQMSGLVADKVVDALASASMTLDPLTLSMIMKFYIASQRPESAIRIFEAATGFAGDGSSRPCKVVIAGKSGGQILPSESALNLYTGTALMQAQAALNDLDAVFCTLAALEGKGGEIEGRLESAPWPWTGSYGPIQPDVYSYNVAIAAAVKAGGATALLRALDIFSKMKSPSKVDAKFCKNEVTYNTLISGLSNAGRPEAAFALLNEMKNFDLRPDKFTFTSLIRACEGDGDVQELFFAMKERGVAADVVTYNTMIQTLCNKKKLGQAMKLVSDMELKKISPNSKTYSLIMNGLLQSNKPEACLALFESASRSIKTSELMDNVQVCTTAIAAAAMLKDYELALEIVARMSAKGVKPNLQTYTIVMGACMASDRADLAAKLFAKIKNPDGYAITQAIRANCMIGNVSLALDMVQTNGHLLEGKQAMLAYNSIVLESLRHNQFAVARSSITTMLKKGFIPSKSLFQSIFTILDLKIISPVDALADDSNDRFRFLLFLIDCTSQRKIQIESNLYVAALAYGGRLGGKSRTLSSLILQSKQQLGSGRIIELDDDDKSGTINPKFSTWELLLDNLQDFVAVDPVGSTTAIPQLPRIQVRESKADTFQVLRAEQTVMSMRAKSRKRNNSRPALS